MQSYLCSSCKNYKGDFKCKAFQERIPNEIFLGFEPHKKPLPDQKNDIVFEPIETKPTK